MAFLDPTAIAKLESLAVKARVIVEGALTGLHRAKLRGSSVEFAEHKEYSQGDEIRHIDWKVLGKADRYYIKQFEQESELTCYLVLDASGSMNYRGKGLSKREYASHLVAGLAYLLVHQGDRVGLSIFGDKKLDRYIPARARANHLRTLLGILEKVAGEKQQGDEAASVALARVAELARHRRGLVILVSDLLETDGSAIDVMRHLRARGHDTVLFHILDRDEVEFPFDELTIFDSLESETKLLVDPASIRRIYRKRMKDFLDRTKTECRESGVEYHFVTSDQPFELALMRFLADRLGVAGAGAKAVSR